MKQLLVFLFLLCSASVFAQDVIVKKDGSTIVCRVVELTSSEITYKKWTDLNGSNYVMSRSDASSISYENGKKVDLSDATNLYKPNNQNDGVQQYNDNALLAMDRASHPKKKRKFNIRAAYAHNFPSCKFEYQGKSQNLKSASGFDAGVGLVFPIGASNMFVGGDIGFAIQSFKWTVNNHKAVSENLWYFAPYWGYKFPIGNNSISIAPYIGPYIGLLLDVENSRRSLSESEWGIEDGHLKVKESCDAGPYHDRQFGIHIGAKLFLSSNFYFDLHCMKSFTNDDRVRVIKYNEPYSYYEKEFKMFSLMLGLGVQF